MRALRIGFAVVLLSASAEAQTAPKDKSNSQFSLRREPAGGADAATARSRARAGDCAGALSAYDAAIDRTIEPTLRRDRGICHDHLGNPFPAIEDYRAYLTARPDAPDAAEIRQRLDALEAQVSGQERKVVSDEDNPELGRDTNAKATAAVEINESDVHAKPKGPSKGKEDITKSSSYEETATQEKLADSADDSPLRYGSGLVVGAYLMMPRYFFAGGASPLAYGVGATIRYSTGPTISIIGDFGFAGVGTVGENSSYSGPMLFGGIEGRIPLSHFAGDHLLLRGGLGFEHYTVSGTQAAIDLIPIRAAIGYRHVFGPSVGLEVLVDGGAVHFGNSGRDEFEGTIAGTVAFVVGF